MSLFPSLTMMQLTFDAAVTSADALYPVNFLLMTSASPAPIGK